MRFFVIANLLEAGLWSSIGIGFVIHAIAKRGGATSIVVAITFLAFGGSDVVEAHTGAWWRPWWLLVWKGICLVVFVVLLVWRARLTPRTAHPEASSRPSPSPDRG